MLGVYVEKITNSRKLIQIVSLMNKIKPSNNRVDAENDCHSRVLLHFFALRATKCFQQHPRPSRFSGHDKRYVAKDVKP